MSKPNIVIFVCHDLGQHLGCYNQPTVHSPHLDQLAADGVRFENAFCTAPQCSPSRAALFTGRYPHCTGVMGLTHHKPGWDLNTDETHLATHLKNAGYDTVLVGGLHETHRPEDMGFDKLDLVKPSTVYDTARHAAHYIQDRKGQSKPFYMQLGVRETHRPFLHDDDQPDDEHGVKVPPFIRDTPSAQQDFKEFQGSIRRLDENFALILQALKDTGLEENTLVIFTTDHGMAFPTAKCSLYDPGLEVAQIMRWPARGWTGGRVISELVSNVDVVPTLLEMLDVAIPDRVQGKSFLPLLDGKAYKQRDEIFGEMTYHSYYDPIRCIRTKTHKLIVSFTNSPFYMNPAQLYHPPSQDNASERRYPVSKHPMVELYDLAAEPFEDTNLANKPEYAQLKRELLHRLYQWLVATDDPILQGPPPSPHHVATVAMLKENAASMAK